MARYTLVYGVRIVKEGTLVDVTEGRLTLKDGETAGRKTDEKSSDDH